MESFEELGVSPPVVEALAAEGIESPTTLQALAIPVLKRGNSAVLRGGPGSGVLATYGVALLERFEPRGLHPRALVLTGGRDRAAFLALSLARLAIGTGHRAGALGVPWALPERSDILFATPEDLEKGIRLAEVKLDGVGAVVLDEAGSLLEDGGGERVEMILRGIETEALQLVLVSDPLSDALRAFVDRHAKRAVFLPPEATPTVIEGSDVRRGILRVRVLSGSEDDAIPALVSDLLEDDHRHVLTYCRSEDRAADIGDLLGLRGFAAGAPGDPDVPVWLGVDALEAREQAQSGAAEGARVAILSLDVPTDADELDRRHGRSASAGAVLANPRELPHLRRAAAEAGYSLEPWPAKVPVSRDAASTFLREIERVMDESDLLPSLLLLEPLLREREAAEVAAALTLLLRRKTPAQRGDGAGAASGREAEAVAAGARPPAWVRLFLSVGERDGVGPGDVLGAILGEAEIEREQVGRIDLRDTFSRVEVHEAIAGRVIRALNGTTIRGRSVRADFDRKEARAGGAKPTDERSPRGGKPRPGGRERPGSGGQRR